MKKPVVTAQGKEEIIAPEQTEVLRLILRRAIHKEEFGAVPDGRKTPFSDGKKIALVVEGGGMRGTVQAGIAKAFDDAIRLTELALRRNGDVGAAYDVLQMEHEGAVFEPEGKIRNTARWFDHSSLVSVGGPVGFIYAAGDTYKGASLVFSKLMANPEFLDMGRLFKYVAGEVAARVKGDPNGNERDPMMKLDYVIDTLKGKVDPEVRLNLDELRKCKAPVCVVVTETDKNGKHARRVIDITKPVDPYTGKPDEPIILSDEKVFELTRSMCLIPTIGGKPGRFSDAMVPSLDAVPKDADHVIFMTTRRLGTTNVPADLAGRLMIKFTVQLSRLAFTSQATANRYIKFAKQLEKDCERNIIEAQRDKSRFVIFGTPKDYLSTLTNATTKPLILDTDRNVAYVHTMTMFKDAILAEVEAKGLKVKNVDKVTFVPPKPWADAVAYEQKMEELERAREKQGFWAKRRAAKARLGR